VIEYDPTLTMKLLRMANSAVSGSRRRIGTIRDALIRLGTGTVAGFVIGSCVRAVIGKKIPGYNLAESAFWKHSLAAAFAAESIQAHSANWHDPLAFPAALLHDVGKLVLGHFITPELATWLERAVTEGKQPAYLAEREILSLHHGEAGGVIAQHWKLPDCLVHGIIYHHDPQEGAAGIGYVTYLANLVAHQFDTITEAPCAMPSALSGSDVGPASTWLGLTEKDLVDVCAETRMGLRATMTES
jgi:HD-like signal output (HDOD) protein